MARGTVEQSRLLGATLWYVPETGASVQTCVHGGRIQPWVTDAASVSDPPAVLGQQVRSSRPGPAASLSINSSGTWRGFGAGSRRHAGSPLCSSSAQGQEPTVPLGAIPEAPRGAGERPGRVRGAPRMHPRGHRSEPIYPQVA